ncbi:MAG: hypothetical protein HY926_02685 [Elusimicrobia bacterium]|nr:hypothetical protein [Elusimicrobiota bacterium]
MLAALGLGAGTGGAVEYAPVLNATVLGGQYFYQGTNANVAGNVSAVAGAMVKTGDQWSLMPTYAANYQGTKGVSDSVAAGSLFQQEMDHRASLTGIYSPEESSWKLKPSLSYKREFLKQTRDEAWGRGLFDYEKIGAGFEVENVYREPFSYRFGLDYFRIRFPNYQSLESQAPLDPQGNPLTRAGANRNTLDTHNLQFSASGSMPYPSHEPKVALQGGYSLLAQRYIDQTLIDSRGQIQGGAAGLGLHRTDYLQTLSGAAAFPRALRLMDTDCRLDSKLSLSFSHNGSNQNYYDANTKQFFFDAYSYTSYRFGPSFSLSWGEAKRPTAVSLSFNYTRVQYMARQAQGATGVYTGSRLRQDQYQVGLGGVYPISPGFSLRAQTNFLWARSNNSFEQGYAYNYRTANYLMGFTYEY